MASELSPQSIRDIRFREKLRGYHPEDVDAFVAQVAATVESLQRRLSEASTQQPAAAAPAADAAPAESSTDVEESLRRTLILAQRTADMAVKEAQEEAARLVAEAEARRAAIDAEVEETRTRTMSELEYELSGYRQRLYEEREALQRDVATLQGYVAQERERLRIYFSQQLEQINSGVPAIEAPPEMEAAPRSDVSAAPVAGAASGDGDAVVADVPGLPEQPIEPSQDAETGASGEASEAGATGDVAGAASEGEGDDDPFFAELRRAVDDDQPLGPRDDEGTELPPLDERDRAIFNEDEGGGRFLRRRR